MKQRKRGSPRGGRNSRADFHFRPFRELAASTPPADRTPPLPRAESPPQPVAENDDDLFLREMADVRPLAAEERARIPDPPDPAPLRQATSPDAEVLAELSELVTGQGQFDVTDTTEYVEGRVIGLDPRLVRQLRAGAFAYQNHLDLHGMRIEEARSAVARFLERAYRKGDRCVLLVHGRGLNSNGKLPVLKKWLVDWLSRGPGARMVLAFTSTRPCDGGAGALYVLLRRRRRSKQHIQVTEGSKI